MITLESITEDPENVNYLIKWWVSQDDYRYHRVLRRGSVKDFANDVWCNLLNNLRDGKQIDCTLSTVIINQCQWTLGKYIRRSGQRTNSQFLYNLRMARKVKPHDRVGGDEELDLHVHGIELHEALIWIMRTLTFREAAIIRARYGLFGDPALSLEQVGAALRVTRERIRQIESKAIKKIQHHTRARKLLPFIEPEEHIRKRKTEAEKRMQQSEYSKALYEELMKDVD